MAWYEILGIVATIFGLPLALVGYYQLLHRSVVKTVAEGVKNELAPLHKEMRENHGTSLKDQVTITQVQLADFKTDTDRRLTDLEQHLTDQDHRIDGIFRLLVKK